MSPGHQIGKNKNHLEKCCKFLRLVICWLNNFFLQNLLEHKLLDISWSVTCGPAEHIWLWLGTCITLFWVHMSSPMPMALGIRGQHSWKKTVGHECVAVIKVNVWSADFLMIIFCPTFLCILYGNIYEWVCILDEVYMV